MILMHWTVESPRWKPRWLLLSDHDGLWVLDFRWLWVQIIIGSRQYAESMIAAFNKTAIERPD